MCYLHDMIGDGKNKKKPGGDGNRRNINEQNPDNTLTLEDIQ